LEKTGRYTMTDLSDNMTKFTGSISAIIKWEYDHGKTYDEIGCMLYQTIDDHIKEAKK
jgi:hypothetical protein